MPTDIADGPRGLEAAHNWNNGRFVLNNTSLSPRVKVDDIQGLFDLAEAEDPREQLYGRIGERGYPSLPRGKTVVYTGRLQAQTIQQIRAMGADFRAAFSERSIEQLMLIQPEVAYGLDQWGYAARPLQLDIDDKAPPNSRGSRRWREERPFTLALRMLDPRFYLWTDDQEQTGLAEGATATVTNLGTAPTDPVITIHGIDGSEDFILITNPDYEVWGGPATLKFSMQDIMSEPFQATLAPGSEGTLTVDFHSRTAKLVDGDDYEWYLPAKYNTSPRSTWWDEYVVGLPPGTHHITVEGNAGMTWDIFHRHASW